jgi:hypothetical protein
MNPWREYLLLLQDFAQWTGTSGGMISSDLHGVGGPRMDVVTPTKGRETSEDCTRKKGCYPQRHSGRPRPRGILLFHLDVDP